jgi:TolB-like protein/Tfp pilus assembly protein PilF
MGEVYKARDLELDRDVAIKVLQAADPETLRRFEQEARAASALNHPNIVTVHEIGEHEGTPYLVMEFVDGVTLREMLAGGALANDKLVRYASQIAEGLAKAHQAGIVHRDLKPENIIINDDGYIKILDFGLAKLLPRGEAGTERTTLGRETTPGTILGTVGYMSPEQARGQAADFRSDQFSLGAILYEMATGTRAFEGESPPQTLSAIIEDEPEPVTSRNPSVPGHLASIIDRCLSKEPAQRYKTTWQLAKEIHAETLAVPEPARERYPMAAAGVGGLLAIIVIMMVGFFLVDVREWVSGPSPAIESIAVLPIHNASGDPEQEYLADGMTDALINELAHIHELRVISRTSVMQYKDSQKSLPQIGRELDVDVVLEGAVLRSRDRLGFTTQLIDADDDTQLWSNSYERGLEDILVLRKEVARAVAEEMRIVLTPEDRESLASTATVDAQSYDDYQKGAFHLRKYTEEGIRTAIDYAEASIERAPDFAPAHALLAEAYGTLTYVSRVAPAELAGKAKAAAMRALSLDENLAEAHARIAWIRATYDWDWSGADAAFRRALELNPGNSATHGYYAHFLAAMGRFEESLRHARRAEELDPVSPLEVENLAFALYMARRFDESVAESRSGVELHPDHMYLHTRLARALEERGELTEAVAAAEQAHRLSGGDPDRQALLARLYARTGRDAEANAILRELEREAQQGYVPPTAIARIYVGLDEPERALDSLEAAFEVRDGDMYLLKTWPVWDPLREHPRFEELLRRMSFPE